MAKILCKWSGQSLRCEELDATALRATGEHPIFCLTSQQLDKLAQGQEFFSLGMLAQKLVVLALALRTGKIKVTSPSLFSDAVFLRGATELLRNLKAIANSNSLPSYAISEDAHCDGLITTYLPLIRAELARDEGRRLANQQENKITNEGWRYLAHSENGLTFSQACWLLEICHVEKGNYKHYLPFLLEQNFFKIITKVQGNKLFVADLADLLDDLELAEFSHVVKSRALTQLRNLVDYLNGMGVLRDWRERFTEELGARGIALAAAEASGAAQAQTLKNLASSAFGVGTSEVLQADEIVAAQLDADTRAIQAASARASAIEAAASAPKPQRHEFESGADFLRASAKWAIARKIVAGTV